VRNWSKARSRSSAISTRRRPRKVKHTH
jgi:hypothetical protein